MPRANTGVWPFEVVFKGDPFKAKTGVSLFMKIPRGTTKSALSADLVLYGPILDTLLDPNLAKQVSLVNLSSL